MSCRYVCVCLFVSVFACVRVCAHVCVCVFTSSFLDELEYVPGMHGVGYADPGPHQFPETIQGT